MRVNFSDVRFITSTPHVCGGRLRLFGTRTEIDDIREALDNGASNKQICRTFEISSKELEQIRYSSEVNGTL